MITEDYVSYEVARLLKEKGFNEHVHYEYHYTISVPQFHKKSHNFNGDEYDNCETEWFSAPTHQMAMKWLREKHHKHCDIGYDIDLYWFFQIIELKELKEHFDYSELKYYYAENETGFNSYEEAVEAALKYTLKNLI